MGHPSQLGMCQACFWDCGKRAAIKHIWPLEMTWKRREPQKALGGMGPTSLGWEDQRRRDRLPTPIFLCFPCGSAGKEFACNEGDLSLIPGLGRSPGEGNSYPLQ